MPLDKDNRLRSKKLRDSAKGQPCSIRIPGHCNGNPETTVLCHGNGGGGTKTEDTWAAFGCSSCHDIVDFRVRDPAIPRDRVIVYHYEGIRETQKYWFKKKLLRPPER